MSIKIEDIPKLLEMVKKYPALHGDAGIHDVTKKIDIIIPQLIVETELLSGYIIAIQQNCNHDWLPVKKYSRLEEATVVESRTCNQCGLHEKRPDKMPWIICWVCWSPMESAGVTPGQGERFHHYKCTNPKCRHTHTHT